MAAIPLSELTLGATSVSGTGVFDQLMLAFKAHLDVEFAAHRIKGADYAQVYLGGMQAAMQNAVAFTLGKQQADKQADLLAQQIILTGSQNAIAIKEALKVIADTTLTDSQNLLTIEQKKLITQKGETEKAQTQDTVTAGAVAGSTGKQNALLTAQIAGFTRNSEYQLAKIMADSYAVKRSTNSTEVPPNGLDNVDIFAVIQKAAAGIGVTLT